MLLPPSVSCVRSSLLCSSSHTTRSPLSARVKYKLRYVSSYLVNLLSMPCPKVPRPLRSISPQNKKLKRSEAYQEEVGHGAIFPPSMGCEGWSYPRMCAASPPAVCGGYVEGVLIFGSFPFGLRRDGPLGGVTEVFSRSFTSLGQVIRDCLQAPICTQLSFLSLPVKEIFTGGR